MAAYDSHEKRMGWLVCIHRILARFDLFCHTGDKAMLSTVQPNEEASAKVRALAAHREIYGTRAEANHQDRHPRNRYDNPRSGNSNGYHNPKRRREDKICSHHGPGSHDSSECRYLKRNRPAGGRASQDTTPTNA